MGGLRGPRAFDAVQDFFELMLELFLGAVASLSAGVNVGITAMLDFLASQAFFLAMRGSPLVHLQQRATESNVRDIGSSLWMD